MENKMKIDVIRPLIDEAFDKGEGFVFTPNGISMKPFIRGGKTKVTIKKYTGGAKKYDIIFYRRADGKYVMHRIVEKNGCKYGVCGDNQWWVEEVDDEQIFAIVTQIEGKKNMGGWIYLETLPIRRFIIHCVKYIKKHLRGRRK